MVKSWFWRQNQGLTPVFGGSDVIWGGGWQPVVLPTLGGYKNRLSQSMADWYAPAPSADFDKTLLRFVSAVYLDTSYNGELLVLSGAPYLQGIDEEFDGDTAGAGPSPVGNDTIGQSFTMTFQIHMLPEKVEQLDEAYPAMDPAWKPDPYRASPAIHTPTHTLNFTSLWSVSAGTSLAQNTCHFLS